MLGLAVDTPVTQLELAREGSTLDRGNRFKSTGRLGTAGLCPNVLLLDYFVGNHVAFMGATQEKAFGMTAEKMQSYLKTHSLE